MAWLAGSTAAHAFTFQDRPAGDTTVPQFNLEEQAKQFRSGSGADGSNKFSTPLGSGKLEFGVQQAPTSNLFPGFGPTPGHRAGRPDFERMLTPENFR